MSVADLDNATEQNSNPILGGVYVLTFRNARFAGFPSSEPPCAAPMLG